MSFFDVLNLIGGLCLFLFGMTFMGQALERRAGNGLKALLGRLTTNRFAGLATGLGVTAVIQSSSATTVMVVGFVNSGLMTLRQSINVIMGANIGTTVTAWILSLAGIDSKNFFVSLLKPSSFTPILALIGIVFYMMSKRHRHDPAWVCDTDVWNGNDVRCCFRSSERSRVSAVVSCVYEPASWRSCRSDLDRHHSVKLSIRRHFAGTCFYRGGYIWRCDPNFDGTAYWHLYHSNCVINWSK